MRSVCRYVRLRLMTRDFVMSLLFLPLHFTSSHSYTPRGEISLVMRFICIHEITLGDDDEKNRVDRWLEIAPWRKKTSTVKNEGNEIGCTFLNLRFSHQEECQKLFRKMSRRYGIFSSFDNENRIGRIWYTVVFSCLVCFKSLSHLKILGRNNNIESSFQTRFLYFCTHIVHIPVIYIL